MANHLGEWERGFEYCRRALEHGRSVNDLRLKVVGWWRMGSTYIQQGDVEPGIRCCEEALAFSPTAFDAAMVHAVRGYGLVKAGKLELGTQELRDAVTWFEQSKLAYTSSLFTLWLAEAYLRQDEQSRATAALHVVLFTSRENGYRHLEGVAERLLAESLAPASEAASHLERGIQILEEIGAHNDVAKALMVEAKQRRTSGDVDEARSLLKRAIEIFERLGTIDGPSTARASLAAL